MLYAVVLQHGAAHGICQYVITAQCLHIKTHTPRNTMFYPDSIFTVILCCICDNTVNAGHWLSFSWLTSVIDCALKPHHLQKLLPHHPAGNMAAGGLRQLKAARNISRSAVIGIFKHHLEPCAQLPE